ncbi:hypothetical protein B0O80DRAFT_123136 [Mortierella sp. GBAus27b]|nr:hypothetical protein B0O80DRAFT_123136 [Mortierella sp. GBAus27b]
MQTTPQELWAQESLTVVMPTTVVVTFDIIDVEEHDPAEDCYDGNEELHRSPSPDSHSTSGRNRTDSTFGMKRTPEMPSNTPSCQRSTSEDINNQVQQASSSPKVANRPSRLVAPKAKSSRSSLNDRHTLNRLEIENVYLVNHNHSLNKDMQHCKQTVQALKNILAQKEEMIERMKQHYRQAHLRIKFMENVLSEHQGKNHGHELTQRPTPLEAHNLERLFGFQEDEEEETLAFLKSLADSGDFDGECNEDSESSEDERDNAKEDKNDDALEKDHGQDPNTLRDTHVEEYENELAVVESTSLDQIPHLGSPAPLQSSKDSRMEQIREAPSNGLYQQPNAPYHSGHANNSTVNRAQVLRRRPHRQLGSIMNDPTVSLISGLYGPAGETPHPTDSAQGAKHSPDKDRPGEVMARCILQKGRTLRDSGHFPLDIDTLDQHSAMDLGLATFPKGCADASMDSLQYVSSPQPNGHPYLGSDLQAVSLTSLPRVHTEATVQPVPLTTRSTDTTGGVKRDMTKGDLIKSGCDRSEKAESSFPLVLRLSSKVKRSRLPGRPKDMTQKTPVQDRQDDVAKALGVSPTEVPISSVPPTLPTATLMEAESLDSEDTTATTGAQAAIPDLARRTLWSRMWKGLGKRVSGLTTPSQQPKSASPGSPATVDEGTVRAPGASNRTWRFRPRPRPRARQLDRSDFVEPNERGM